MKFIIYLPHSKRYVKSLHTGHEWAHLSSLTDNVMEAEHFDDDLLVVCLQDIFRIEEIFIKQEVV